VPFNAAREAADTVARFMSENPDNFEDAEYSFERNVAAPMSKMIGGIQGSSLEHPRQLYWLMLMLW
jgi:hypothetical protein